MTNLHEVYKCAHCANIVQMVHAGGPEPFCCDEKMQLLTEGSSDGAKEKHVPAIEKTANGYKVAVGSVAHPMEEAHYIEWIEIIADGISYKKFLKPGDSPVAEFCIDAKTVVAREYCNLHGHFKAEF